jgi:hypothetical protein
LLQNLDLINEKHTNQMFLDKPKPLITFIKPFEWISALKGLKKPIETKSKFSSESSLSQTEST